MKNMKVMFTVLWAVVITGVHLGGAIATARGQSRLIPDAQYYRAFPDLYEGDFRPALRAFSSEYRTAFQFGDKRYLDSVCILTMLGECHYRVGDYQRALQMYNDSLRLYIGLDGQGWQNNIQLPPLIQPDTSAVQRARITWGNSQRTGRIANVPDSISVLRGRLDASAVYETTQGGVFDPAELRQVNITEVLRCTALAVSRRRQIMGRTGRYDPMSVQLLSSLKKSNIGNGTLMGAFNGIVYGMILSSVGEHDKAAAVLKSSLQFNGDMDHGLTPLGLAELAHIGIQKDQPALALKLAMEATYSAAIFQQPDVIEQGFELATQAHLLTNRTALPALTPAIAWAGRERTEMLEAALGIRQAECLAEAGDAAGSERALAAAGKLMNNRNSISQTMLAARLRYLTAVNKFLVGDWRGGQNALAVAMQELTAKSPSLFRLQLANRLASDGTLTERQADQLYTALLQDPTDLLWRTEPMDAMAFLLTPHVDALERWFEILLNRKQIDRAVGVADQIRRHRFYAALPLGGRLLSLRWVLQGDAALLDTEALKQRQVLLTRHTRYRDLLNQTKLLNATLDGLPPQLDPKSDDSKTQRDTLRSLAEIYDQQESFIASIALRREPAKMAFPPTGDTESLQDRVDPGQIIFSALQTKAGYHFFSFDLNRARYLGLVDAGALKKGLGKMLVAMGVAANFADPQVLASDSWKEAVREFQKKLFEDIAPEQLASAKELVVIPDGLLWYVPFEAFRVGQGDSERSLGEQTKIRYSPTLFLSFAKPSSAGEIKSTGVVTGAMYPKTDSALAEMAFTEVLEKEIQAKKVDGSESTARLDQLVVLNGSSGQNRGLGLQPLASEGKGKSKGRSRGNDKNQNGGTLLDWMRIPFAAPEHTVLMGLNSIGGAGGLTRPDGSEMFLAATSALAAGGRSVVLSRWNAGGQMQVNLASQYARNATAMPVTTALQNAAKHVRGLEVDIAKEPRLKKDTDLPKLTGSSPFFWASPVLVSYDDQRAVNLAGLPAGDGADVKPADAAVDGQPTDGQAANLGAEPAPLGGAVEPDAGEGGSDTKGMEVVEIQPQPVETVGQGNAGQEKKAGDDSEDEDDDDDQGGAVWKIGGSEK